MCKNGREALFDKKKLWISNVKNQKDGAFLWIVGRSFGIIELQVQTMAVLTIYYSYRRIKHDI